MSLFLGLDIGTTSTIGLLIELPDRILAKVSRPVTLHSVHPGWAEEDPAQWWANCCAIVPELLEKSGRQASEIAGIGVAGMLPATILLDSQGNPLRYSIQQSDGRAGAEVDEMRGEIDETAFLAAAGNGVNQQLVGAKMRWLKRHEPEVVREARALLGSYDYINFRLTGVARVEQNWALEAGIVNVATNEIDLEQAALTGIDPALLPPLAPSSAVMGHVTEEAAAETGLATGIPVVGGAADMIASCLGAGVVSNGDVLLKFGGAVDILTATDKAIPDGRLFLDYHLVPGLWMPNGCMSTGGSVLNWFVETFASGTTPLDGSRHAALDALAADRPAGAMGLTFLPYLLGEKTPLHDPSARGALNGLTLSHDLGHIWRSVLESYAYAIRHHIETFNEIGYETTRFFVSDGGANSNVWMGIVADVLGVPLQRLGGHPGSCLGAAWVAAVGCGSADWTGIAALTKRDALITPNPENRQVYDAGYAQFRNLYERLEGSSS
ncbi:FGGY-family carbohydrate kinase [Roseibium aggregatum]|uniref:FGGY-family carbohydrate kinase n=1 Tax=Roseibium aggregatum TaxID=187304 RepID=A0A939EFP3_9HYPH|nr:FGGY-family carbohydrate kinase [Roseibium aggregatum]MBN9671617.1 FGGY-family carbohydrate kinase [Roseibium aggregatum]